MLLAKHVAHQHKHHQVPALEKIKSAKKESRSEEKRRDEEKKRDAEGRKSRVRIPRQAPDGLRRSSLGHITITADELEVTALVR